MNPESPIVFFTASDTPPRRDTAFSTSSWMHTLQAQSVVEEAGDHQVVDYCHGKDLVILAAKQPFSGRNYLAVSLRFQLNPNRDEAETAHLRSLPSTSNRLHLFQIDLLDPDSILATIRGVSGVFHLTSPCIITRVQDPQGITRSSGDGDSQLLRAAKESGVRWVVVTSLISAIVPSPGWPADRVKDESCWTNLDYCRQKEVRI
ncbi:hypothetical protein ZIOFF_028062 [Zingiber officinale]|uniref:3-beta hydroxysteroid dehydrogenase/isomerase domain-containing protein n=1 Tax=Zingiber officinale TaxID=94328 RepID=A0A8J5GTW7_ZINOF|nr:hypothetical protein ZIOFF_028062 [Zingiber officinale]